MGLLSSLKSAGSKVVSAAYTKVLDPFTTVVSNPVQSIRSAFSKDLTFKQVVQETVSQPKSKQIAGAITTGLTLGTGLGIAKSVATKGITQVAASVIPTTTKGKIIAAAVTPAVVGAVVSNPKIITEVAEIPTKAASFGADVGTAVKDPTKENIINIAKENPLITGLVVGAGALTLGKTLLPAAGAVTNIQTKEAVQDLTTQLKIIPTAAPAVVETTKQVTTTQPPFTPTTAVTAATAPLPTTTTRKARKAKAKPQIINQKVNVVVQNKNTSVGIRQNKNYLKRSILV